MKKFALLGVLVLAGASNAAELFDNGPVVNRLDRSVARKPITTFGVGAQTSENNTVADDFTVSGPGWSVSDIDFYSYQTGATSFGFTSVTWSIKSGDVNTGSVVASGTTGVTNGGLEGYRVTLRTFGDKSRAIYDLNADIADVNLAAGHYWLTWNIAGDSSFTGPWVPPTSDGRTGNAQQSIAGGEFALIDAGSGAAVDLPFAINGTVTAVPEPATAATLAAGLATLLVAARRRRSSKR